MLRKIILPLVLLVFAQQKFYGMKNNSEEGEKAKLKKADKFWGGINGYIKKLTPLWIFLDNVPFQYGCSRIWKHGEAYYGLSNGIGFFPSFLNFRWLKIGIGDVHINVINAIINYARVYVEIKYDYYSRLVDDKAIHNNPVWRDTLKWWLFYTLVTDTQLLSFKIFNCVKIKIISIGAIIASKINKELVTAEKRCFFTFSCKDCCKEVSVPGNFFLWSLRIEINIPRIINYLKGE